jgi:tripeptide aminopeptidase
MRKRAPQLFVNCLLVSAILWSVPARSTIPISANRAAQNAQPAQNVQVQAALAWFKPHLNWINDEQARLTEIPAPPFAEAQRAEAVKVLLAAVGLDVHLDKVGNVIGELHGANDREVVLIAAHLDTVFPAGTEIKVRREKDRMYAPGISDNGTGLVSLVALARAVHEARLKPQRTILFVADVGEEGEGNLRGMRALVDSYRDKLKAVVVLDGSGTDHVTTKALASRRMEAVISGPGGHSWSDSLTRAFPALRAPLSISVK